LITVKRRAAAWGLVERVAAGAAGLLKGVWSERVRASNRAFLVIASIITSALYQIGYNRSGFSENQKIVSRYRLRNIFFDCFKKDEKIVNIKFGCQKVRNALIGSGFL
jgi:hypothetical protein